MTEISFEDKIQLWKSKLFSFETITFCDVVVDPNEEGLMSPEGCQNKT